MEKIWHELYKEAKKKIKTHEIPPFIEAGTNACALLTESGKMYSGVSITSNTNINTSAEKSAIIAMFNDNEHTIKKMVILNELEEVIPPSTECFDYLLELGLSTEDMEILVDYEKKEILPLSELIPSWWGTYRNKK